MKVTVFGVGYVGLVQAAVLADAGHNVICVDVDQQKIDNLKKGIIHSYEPGLEALVKEGQNAGRLHFTINAKQGVEHSQLQFIAVGTPPVEDGSADLQYVLAVAETIARYMEKSCIIVNKSTVPVGTADLVRDKIALVLKHRNVNHEYSVVSNPEFLKEGAAVSDCMKPDRIIIGTSSEKAIHTMRELYAPFNRNRDRMIFMDARSAELTKYAANCMLATKISFMNEIAMLAEELDADIEQVRKGIGSDPRIGYDFIYPGCGYGGSCFPKDVRALNKTAESLDFDAIMLKAVEKRNARQKNVVFEKINKYFQGNLKDKTFALWGLSFKPNTDDMRDAPSRDLMEALWNAGAKVQAYDPKAMKEAQRIYGDRHDLVLCSTPYSALNKVEALVICTEWKLFRAPDFSRMAEIMNRALIFDGRNMYEPKTIVNKGFEYYSIGQPQNKFKVIENDFI